MNPKHCNVWGSITKPSRKDELGYAIQLYHPILYFTIRKDDEL